MTDNNHHVWARGFFPLDLQLVQLAFENGIRHMQFAFCRTPAGAIRQSARCGRRDWSRFAHRGLYTKSRRALTGHLFYFYGRSSARVQIGFCIRAQFGFAVTHPESGHTVLPPLLSIGGNAGLSLPNGRRQREGVLLSPVEAVRFVR